MSVLHCAGHSGRDGSRRLPADDGTPLRCGVTGDAVRLHVAGNPNMLITAVGEHAERVGTGPALDEVIALRLLRTARHVRGDAGISADAETGQPCGKAGGFDPVAQGDDLYVRCGLGPARCGKGGLHIRRGSETLLRVRCQLSAPRVESMDCGPYIAQRKVGAARRSETGILPHRRIVFRSIAGVRCDEIKGDAVRLSRRQLESHFFRCGQRSDGLLP